MVNCFLQNYVSAHLQSSAEVPPISSDLELLGLQIEQRKLHSHVVGEKFVYDDSAVVVEGLSTVQNQMELNNAVLPTRRS